jgi:hypothetical protein
VSLPRRVTVEKRKWDRTVSARAEGWLLEDDDALRLWLVTAGTRCERPRRGEVETVSADRLFAATGAWWVASVTGRRDDAPPEYTVDAALSPASPRDGVLAFVDLDLDLHIADGEVRLTDRDDFRERCRAMGYPAEIQAGAWEGLRDAAARHAEGRWPFDGWLGRRLREAQLVAR